MQEYKSKISLTKNSRGIYCLDTSIGCSSGMENEQDGCYNDCYSARAAKRYGYDFSKTILRKFTDEFHRRKVLDQINRAKLDFIRIGCSGDPSENWKHAIDIIKQVDTCNKEIVIITRHWGILTQAQLDYFAKINICVNTSVSALDKPTVMDNCLAQFHRLKKYCKSVLRVVSCDFNLQNKQGKQMAEVQHLLMKNDPMIDTVFRPSRSNKLVIDGVINVKEKKFMDNKKTLVSQLRNSAYLGKCNQCHEMCGANMAPIEVLYPVKRGILKQLDLFKK